jgi:Site-specific recombinase XerD
MGSIKEMSFDDGMKLFLNYQKIKNSTEETIKYYENCALYFIEFFDGGICSEIKEETVLNYIQHLQSKDIKDITINSYLRGLRAILYYFMEQGYIEGFKIRLIKADKEIKDTYTEKEIEILLLKPDTKKCTFKEFRTWAFTNFFLGTGLRLSSVLNLKIEDISFEDMEIKIKKNKNRKHQIIPLSFALCEVLRAFLSYRGGTLEDYLFSTQYGEQLSKSTVQKDIQEYNRLRGINKTSIHLYRHTFAKMWIINEGDIFTLQRILGHSDLEIVKEYVEIYGNDLQMKYNKHNPLDRMAIKKKKDKIKMRFEICQVYSLYDN